VYPKFAALILAAAVSAAVPAQQTIPDVITRPQPGGEPRYPQDTVIGELGSGEAPASAYQAARSILAAVLRGTRESPLFAGIGPARIAEIFGSAAAVSPEKYRIGGGRVMPDGTVSFLFRFTGREQGIAGEIYVRQDLAGDDGESSGADLRTGPWRFDDILLDEPHSTTVRREPYPYSFTPYERFY
jgi:hypothetical protein